MSLGGKWNKYGTAPKNLTDAHCEEAYSNLTAKVKDLLPLSQHDSNIVSDEDALIKFLIARRYNVEQAEKMVRHSTEWRKTFGCEELFKTVFPETLHEKWPSAFYGKDKEGHPIYIEQPDAGKIRDLIDELGEETMFKWHIYTVERQRQIMKSWNTDRVSIILDAAHITMGIVANTRAIGFLKRISTHGQEVYPEGMRYMFIINAPMAVSIGWKIISPLLDPVVRDKVHIWGTNFLNELKNYVAAEDIPKQLGGPGGDWYQLTGNATEYVIPKPHQATPAPSTTRSSSITASTTIATTTTTSSPATVVVPSTTPVVAPSTCLTAATSSLSTSSASTSTTIASTAITSTTTTTTSSIITPTS